MTRVMVEPAAQAKLWEAVLTSGRVRKVRRDAMPPPTYPYLGRPAAFIEEELGVFMWSKQREIVDALPGHRRIAIKSCHDAGKSFIVTQLVAYWLSDKVHEPGSAFVVTSAPTGPQVKEILWKEIGGAHGVGKLPGRTTMRA